MPWSAGLRGSQVEPVTTPASLGVAKRATRRQEGGGLPGVCHSAAAVMQMLGERGMLRHIDGRTMPQQFATPLLLRNKHPIRLQRIPLCDRTLSEGWLQRQLFEHPLLIPVDELEPAFEGLIPVAMELPTECGPLDVAYINSDGLMTLVETKLWRNPQARREVVAQVVDYARCMASWSYMDLVEAMKAATGSRAKDPLVDLVSAQDEIEPAQFMDRVSRNLRLGRFLLLVIGDGISEGVEELADFIQQAPQIGFTMGLVEMGLFSPSGRPDDELFVQPRVLARTVELTRTVVEIRYTGAQPDVTVSIPATGAGGKGPRKSISEDVFFEELAGIDPSVKDFVQQLLQELPRHGVQVEWKSGGPAFYYRHPGVKQRFSLGYCTRGGLCGFGWLTEQCERTGANREAAVAYFRDVAKLLPDAVGGDTGVQKLRRKGWDEFPISALAQHKNKWFALIDTAIAEIRKSLDQEEGG